MCTARSVSMNKIDCWRLARRAPRAPRGSPSTNKGQRLGFFLPSETPSGQPIRDTTTPPTRLRSNARMMLCLDGGAEHLLVNAPAYEGRRRA